MVLRALSLFGTLLCLLPAISGGHLAHAAYQTSKIDINTLQQVSNSRWSDVFKARVMVPSDFDCARINKRHDYFIVLDSAPKTPEDIKRVKGAAIRSVQVFSHAHDKRPGMYCGIHRDGPLYRFRLGIVANGNFATSH